MANVALKLLRQIIPVNSHLNMGVAIFNRTKDGTRRLKISAPYLFLNSEQQMAVAIATFSDSVLISLAEKLGINSRFDTNCPASLEIPFPSFPIMMTPFLVNASV